MRKVLPVIFACFIGIAGAYAAVRDASTISRSGVTQNTSGPRTARQANVISRAATQSVRVRNTTQTTATPRTTTARATTTNASRAATTRSTKNTTGRVNKNTTTRAATVQTSRAATIDATQSKTFGTGYNTCRDAYFTCMDQFCATQDDTYRRCVCSSRLYEIKGKQRALNQSAEQLQDFKDLNIEAIPKTAAEVQAMQSASEGEMVSSFIKDKTSSIAQLSGISAVLSTTKSKSLSTAGRLDIAGDINAIWATTDLTSGLNISNLTGETLYNAVHSQCVNLVADRCSSKSLLNMVVSAYGMYIENDCSLLSNALDKKKLSANAAIRETEREMNVARLENYDAHNSSSINDCIAMVRRDITADAACGADYVHCLDTSGLYLNKATGEPIYTSNFYQLGSTLSLSADMLTNDTNRILVAELNRKRAFAENSLDTCRDLADEVWDEFMRQSIIEIYQGQQTRIRNVKNECLDVVNKCYDAQTNSLKDFSNVKEQLLLGSRLELSEELCREKLAACSNLYGGGPNGMQELLNAMRDITTQKIAQNCYETLLEYANQLCAVPSSDSLHSYPYACRVYAPGEQRYASKWTCNRNPEKDVTVDDQSSTGSGTSGTSQPAGTCASVKKYTRCNYGYYMVAADGTTIIYPPYTEASRGNQCRQCPADGCPTKDNNTKILPCGDDYDGSLYQKLVRYAIQACMRPSDVTELLSTEISDKENLWQERSVTILQDVNAAMDLIRASMASSLKTECERLGGYWITSYQDDTDSESQDDTNSEDQNNTNSKIGVFQQFYNETGANKKWGYCADPDAVSEYYAGESGAASGGEGSGSGDEGGS